MKGFKALTLAQWRGFYRDKQTLFWAIAFPLMFLLIFGGIFSGGSTSKSSLVVAGDVPLLQHMPQEGKDAFDQLFETKQGISRDDALDQVKHGKLDALVESGADGALVLHYSQADQAKAARIRSIFDSFVNRANVAATGQTPKFKLDAQQVEDQSLQPIQYVVPGILGYAVSMGAIFGAAMTLVHWRGTKLLRRLRLSPVKPFVLIGSRTLISLVISTIQVAIFLGVGVAFFGLKLTSSWYMVLPLAWCATLAFMAIGLFTGSVSKTEEGAAGLANLIVLPMSFMSGSFIPLDSAPAWMTTVAKFLPLGYLNNGMLDTMVRGDGPQAALLPCLVLLGFALVIGLIAARFFKWDTD